MNKEENFDSDSDQSDEDFCPENAPDEAVSADESDSADADDSEVEEDAEVKPKQSRNAKNGSTTNKLQSTKKVDKTAARSTRQSEAQGNGGTNGALEKDELESDEEVDKSRSDALWADFLCDVGEKDKTVEKASEKAQKATPAKEIKQIAATASAKKDIKQVREVLDFAGEEVVVEKTLKNADSKEQQSNESPKAAAARSFGAVKRPANGNAAGAGGLGSLLNQLGKKKKMSVLEKSQLDWKTFKNEAGIDEQLQTYNKGKDGYLERQDFLQRTDLKQFEIEKSMRQSRRQN